MKNECENKKDGQKSTPLSEEIKKHFLNERKIFLWDSVTDETAADIVEKLLYLDMLDPSKEITFYMSTPGGSISAGMSIYDTMKLIKSPIKVVVTGIAMSMGSILLSAAPKGKRFLFPSARVIWIFISHFHSIGKRLFWHIEIYKLFSLFYLSIDFLIFRALPCYMFVNPPVFITAGLNERIIMLKCGYIARICRKKLYMGSKSCRKA